MKLLLENWREYLNEEEYSITPEQNQALKNLYIKIRPLLHHFSEWLQQNNIHPSEVTDDMIIQKYTPPAPFGNPSQGWGEMKLDVSEFKSIFPNLSDKFYIAISDEIKEGELIKDGYGTIEGIKIGVMLFKDLQEVKQTIHHELQHIIDEGTSPGEGIEGIINYLTDPGEVKAHAKEAAYRFYKKFPEAQEVDFKIVSDWRTNFKNYYSFATRAEDIVKKTDIEPEMSVIMKKAGDNFIKYANYFLGLFKGNK
jgi:hypothetical protein